LDVAHLRRAIYISTAPFSCSFETFVKRNFEALVYDSYIIRLLEDYCKPIINHLYSHMEDARDEKALDVLEKAIIFAKIFHYKIPEKSNSFGR